MNKNFTFFDNMIPSQVNNQSTRLDLGNDIFESFDQNNNFKPIKDPNQKPIFGFDFKPPTNYFNANNSGSFFPDITKTTPLFDSKNPLNNLVENTNDLFNIKNQISTFFKNPLMIKVQNQYINNFLHSIYKTPISCLLCDGYRYLIVVVKEQEGKEARIGSNKKLSELNWVSLQTRFFKIQDQDNFLKNVKSTDINFSQKLKYPFDIKERTKEKSIYSSSNIRLKIELLHTGKSTHEYSNQVMLDSALNTFSCVLTVI